MTDKKNDYIEAAQEIIMSLGLPPAPPESDRRVIFLLLFAKPSAMLICHL